MIEQRYPPLSKMFWESSQRSTRVFQLLLVIVGITVPNLVAIYLFTAANSCRSQSQDSSLSHRGYLNGAQRWPNQLNETQEDLRKTQKELIKVRQELEASLQVIQGIAANLLLSTSQHQGSEVSASNTWPPQLSSLAKELQEFVAVRKLPLGYNPSLNADIIVGAMGFGCFNPNLKPDIAKYMHYRVGADCPDDESLAQKLLLHGCEPLPRRRCFARMPSDPEEPLELPTSLWESPSDDSILWTAYSCKSFDCLNARAKKKVFADCLDCFDLQGRERRRWVMPESNVDFSIADVLAFKQGTLRIGLDIGGGTGSFAARMWEHNVTIVTSTLNLGGPFNNFIGHRGIVPLFLTISQRFPFFDNTLDIVHSMHVLSNWIPTESLEFTFYDIDRILRPGGLLWIDRFFCKSPQLNSTYAPMIERLGYKKLRWETAAKLDRGPQLQEYYLSALLEKPLKRGAVL
ncbi:hypothetical protein O6H91_19G072400 [Diphasiastrum complanatum]|uniref:Uncharacterized protein n=3 Tax=Diphasiastrum complanatum TaxID=34168 RepID=A0ACC2AWH6_DIPCM|nr:hypothetical protein O6H91_19G072400 [Diphasiastrum complanatum]KAJ7521874.1 hypothetical protein O6H91_19G072400 [Diphasiastrum complanatum]KAJ7521875.1 hypothetical protein O6H91_19G072400 [Diphasiastrum complanatum]